MFHWMDLQIKEDSITNEKEILSHCFVDEASIGHC